MRIINTIKNSNNNNNHDIIVTATTKNVSNEDDDEDGKNAKNTKKTSLFIARNKVLVSDPSEFRRPTQSPLKKSCDSLKSHALYRKENIITCHDSVSTEFRFLDLAPTYVTRLTWIKKKRILILDYVNSFSLDIDFYYLNGHWI